MKAQKKKKRLRASKRAGKDVVEPKEEEEQNVLNRLIETFSSASLDMAASAYREANGDANKAAEILGVLLENTEDPSTSSSLCSSSGLSSLEDFNKSGAAQNSFNGKTLRGCKPKKLAAATGTVSTILGKDYVMSSAKKDLQKSKGFSSVQMEREEAEQFLCSMLGDGSELSMAVVRDVLCNCGYNVAKASEALLELSSYSYDLSKTSGCSENSSNDRETRFIVDCRNSLADRASDSTSHSSGNEDQDNVQPLGFGYREYSNVLVSSGTHPLTNTRSTDSELPQKVLDSLFNSQRSLEHDPGTMNWKSLVKKMESLGQRFDSCPSNTELPLKAYDKGDEYVVFRNTARQHWDSMRSYYQKAVTAFSNGEREYAAYLSEQGKLQNKLAREADEKASREIFKAKNKRIENVLTIDLHGQHVKQAIRLLKQHLLFGAYVSSIQLLRVITGCGTHGLGKSKVKQSVINLLEKEGLQWRAENQGTLVIKLDGCTQFSFLDSDSDAE